MKIINSKKKIEQALVRSWFYICGLMTLVLTGSILSIPIQPTGLIHSMPDEQGVYSYATGTYIGGGIVLTNWHVLRSLSWRQEYFQLPLWNEHIYNFEIPIEWVIYSEQDIDLAIGKLAPSKLDRLNVRYECLSSEPLAAGEILTVISSPLGRYPSVEAHLVVDDPAPLSRMDQDPRIKPEKRYASVSFVAHVEPGQESLVDGGSSGGAVLNEKGQLVGLLWSRYDLPDGSREVLVSPVSGWLPLLESADIAPKYRDFILNQICK
jgi:hypothetical protein